MSTFFPSLTPDVARYTSSSSLSPVFLPSTWSIKPDMHTLSPTSLIELTAPSDTYDRILWAQTATIDIVASVLGYSFSCLIDAPCLMTHPPSSLVAHTYVSVNST